jgi:hypothetical protein
MIAGGFTKDGLLLTALASRPAEVASFVSDDRLEPHAAAGGPRDAGADRGAARARRRLAQRP